MWHGVLAVQKLDACFLCKQTDWHDPVCSYHNLFLYQSMCITMFTIVIARHLIKVQWH